MSDTKNQDKSADPALQDNKDDNLDKNQSTKGNDKSNVDIKGDSPDDYGRKQKARAERAEQEAQEAKAKIAELEGQINAKSDPQGEISDLDLEKLADEHDVPVEFVKKLSGSLISQASKAAEKLVSSKLSEKDKEAQKEAILNDFKRDFDKLENDFEGELNEQAVRMHYLAEKAKNSDHSVSDSIESIYGSFKSGKATVEDDPRGADPAGEKIDFVELSKDPKKLEAVIKDPKARTKYYDWRDKQGM